MGGLGGLDVRAMVTYVHVHDCSHSMLRGIRKGNRLECLGEKIILPQLLIVLSCLPLQL